jgi:Domain of unknown function (DUF4167)
MNMKRMRGRNHRPNGGGGGNNGGGFRNQQNGIPLNRNHVFDSSGPEMRVRGTAQQLYEKYQQLARDASSNGDRVTGEAYYQHAEHYFRIISAINQAQGQPPPVHSGQGQPNVQHGQGGQGSYQNPNQGVHQGQERNGVHPEQNGQQNGHYGNQNRRFEQNNGERRPAETQQDLQLGEPVQQAEPLRNEARQESRPAPVEGRPNEGRSFEPRRNEHGGQRNRPDFQRNDRNNNDRAERYREAPAVDTRIDISSALEAELAASVAEPDELSLPVNLVAREVAQPVQDARPAEARAIPIIPDAPPPAAERPVKSRAAEAQAAEGAPAPAAPAPKPRGRPRAVKAAPKE